MKSLLIYPTHKNCDETQEHLQAAGILAEKYLPRVTTQSFDAPVNCWNPDADIAEQMGFPVVKTVCMSCPHRHDCLIKGYLGDVIRAEKSMIALCTHKRVEHTGFAELTKDRYYVAVHEEPVDLLRPRLSASEHDLVQVLMVLNYMLSNPILRRSDIRSNQSVVAHLIFYMPCFMNRI